MNSRQQAAFAIRQAQHKKTEKRYEQRHLFNEFGANVFNERVQNERLSSSVFNALQNAVKEGHELDPGIADAVAHAMKEWALERGVTHFCHWFQPLTDLTAEKHDSLFVPGKDGTAVCDFDGSFLIRGEPDASSFPSGGLRTTFEARGYTAWDPSSPAFILGRTLVIPTAFISWTGDALDKKTPLLRSMEALNTQALRLLALFGDHETKRVVPTVGAEQEYFLIDQHYYYLRPDLLSCGRTLFGAQPSKGQELEDQYLSAIPDRVIALMEECEFELMRLGVPIKTRHNEVAPSQYELAISFETANLASDHLMLVMETLKRIAKRHGMEALLHEKPFAGVNGSGKHNNWSLATDTGHNLLEPGETPQENARFLVFCAAVIRAVHKYASLLRLSVASAGNDHRLGLHEAPPAIISVFLGEQLYGIFQSLIKGENRKAKQAGELKLGVSMLPKIPCHTSDRNRTSPFAFTGNKFEFRAVGSSENIAKCNTFINTIVAESLDYFATELEGVKGDMHHALQGILSKAAKVFQPVLFEGDNYNPAWHKEASKRKLPHIKNTVDAAMHYISRESVALFTKYKVYSLRELTARQQITLSKYVKKLKIEAKTTSNIAHTLLIPAAINYLNELGKAMHFLSKADVELLKTVSRELGYLNKSVKILDDTIHKCPKEELEEEARYARDRILPAMQEVRGYADLLEGIVSDQHWPLPKYREMLFIK